MYEESMLRVVYQQNNAVFALKTRPTSQLLKCKIVYLGSTQWYSNTYLFVAVDRHGRHAFAFARRVKYSRVVVRVDQNEGGRKRQHSQW
jgi:hypothetical protein